MQTQSIIFVPPSLLNNPEKTQLCLLLQSHLSFVNGERGKVVSCIIRNQEFLTADAGILRAAGVTAEGAGMGAGCVLLGQGHRWDKHPFFSNQCTRQPHSEGIRREGSTLCQEVTTWPVTSMTWAWLVWACLGIGGQLSSLSCLFPSAI